MIHVALPILVAGASPVAAPSPAIIETSTYRESARWALPQVDEPDEHEEDGIRLRWRFNKVKLRVPLG